MKPNKSEQLIIDTLMPLKEYQPRNTSSSYYIDDDEGREKLGFIYYVPGEFEEMDLPENNIYEALTNIFKKTERVKYPKASWVYVTIDQPIRHRVIREALGYEVQLIMGDFDEEVSRMEKELEEFKKTIDDPKTDFSDYLEWCEDGELD